MANIDNIYDDIRLLCSWCDGIKSINNVTANDYHNFCVFYEKAKHMKIKKSNDNTLSHLFVLIIESPHKVPRKYLSPKFDDMYASSVFLKYTMPMMYEFDLYICQIFCGKIIKNPYLRLSKKLYNMLACSKFVDENNANINHTKTIKYRDATSYSYLTTLITKIVKKKISTQYQHIIGNNDNYFIYLIMFVKFRLMYQCMLILGSRLHKYPLKTLYCWLERLSSTKINVLQCLNMDPLIKLIPYFLPLSRELNSLISDHNDIIMERKCHAKKLILTDIIINDEIGIIL